MQKSCKADECRRPWQQLDSGIRNFREALQEQYDDFFARSYREAKVGWKQCYSGLHAKSSSTLYDLDNEEPLWLNSSVRAVVHRSSANHGVPSMGLCWLITLFSTLVLLTW